MREPGQLAPAGGLPGALILCGGLLLCGCGPASEPAAKSGSNLAASDLAWRQELFDSAIDNLHRLEQFQPQAMLEQVRQQLNQSVDWNREVDWKPDPMLAALPRQLQQLPMFLNLEDLKLDPYDALHLQEAVTLHNVAELATHGAGDDLKRAELLFDWTIRNIQPQQPSELTDERGQPLRSQHLPYQSLFFGRGDGIDRAWIFLLLCRQQDLDAVVLAIPGATPGDPPRPWSVGVLIDNDIYPFDPSLGVVCPRREVRGAATLAELAADDGLLRQLDVDGEQPYPLKSSDLSALIALVEASPAYLSKRMKVVESKLAGDRKIVLTTAPSAVADRMKNQPQIAQVRLWGVPLERTVSQLTSQARAVLERELLPYRFDLLPPTLQQPAIDLQRGRTLHLSGILAADEGAPSANKFYQQARMADDEINAAALNDVQRTILRRAKEDASYWLALVAFERGRYETAIDHLEKRTLAPAAASSERWRSGAFYNLGRAYEALGNTDQAQQAYEKTTDSQRQGNLLRAHWLKNGIRLEGPCPLDEALTPSGAHRVRFERNLTASR